MNARRLARAIAAPFLVLGAVFVVVVEDGFWRLASAAAEAVGRTGAMRAAERGVASLRPEATFLVFLVPMGLVLAVKVAALHMMARGHFWGGLAVIAAAKIGGTAVSARLYQVARPKLMLVPRFVALLAWATRLRAASRAYLEGFPAWNAASAAARGAVAAVRAASGRLRGRPGRMAAAGRLARRAWRPRR